MTAWRSSICLPVTRSSSPWIEAWTLSLLSLMILTMALAFSCSMPSRILASRLERPARASSTSPQSKLLRSRPRRLAADSNISESPLIFEASSATNLSFFSFWSTVISMGEPRKSKRAATAFLVLLMALSSSAKLNRETMSNDGMGGF